MTATARTPRQAPALASVSRAASRAGRTALPASSRRTAPRGRHPQHDAPDTEAAFRRLAALPVCREHHVLRGELVEAWLPMAHRIATRFRNRGESMDDLKQVAAVALVKAVDRFEPAQGSAFESYAVPTITGELKRHFRDHAWAVHVPRRVQELRGRVRRARIELERPVPRPRTSCSRSSRRACSDYEWRVRGRTAFRTQPVHGSAGPEQCPVPPHRYGRRHQPRPARRSTWSSR